MQAAKTIVVAVATVVEERAWELEGGATEYVLGNLGRIGSPIRKATAQALRQQRSTAQGRRQLRAAVREILRSMRQVGWPCVDNQEFERVAY